MAQTCVRPGHGCGPAGYDCEDLARMHVCNHRKHGPAITAMCAKSCGACSTSCGASTATTATDADDDDGTGSSIVRTAGSPTYTQHVITTMDKALCVPENGGRVQYTGRACGDGTQIEWTSAKTLDMDPALTQAQCEWNWLTHANRAFYGGSCGVPPKVEGASSLPTLPMHVIMSTITTKVKALCVPENGGRVQYTGRACGDGTQIEWTSAKTLDMDPALTQARCEWNWLTHANRAFYGGSCGVPPKVEGASSLPTRTPRPLAPTTSADGTNVQSVKAQGGGAKAVYRRVFGDRWVEETVDPSGTRNTFWFSEVRRDKWSVYLYDFDTVLLRLDLYTKKVMLVAGPTLYSIVDAASSTCATGGFSPRADGYYLIGADGLYWAHTGHGQPVRLARDSTGASAHWRFKKSSKRTAEWVIVNRQTGDAISIKKNHKVHNVMVADARYPVSFESTCKGNQVKFDSAGGVRCGCGQEQGPGALCAYTAGTTLVISSMGPSKRVTRVGCGKSCPPEYDETDSTNYVFCKSRRCASRAYIIPSPAIQDVDKYWDVAPVATFRKIGLVKMPVVKVIGNADEEAATGMAKSVVGRTVDLVGGLVGTREEFKLPIIGAVGSALANFFIDNFFPGTSTSLEDKLDDLANQILNVVDAKIDVAVVKGQVRIASNKFDEARKHFHVTYAREKRFKVQPWPGANVNTMELLASELQGYSQDYEKGLKTLSADHEKYDHSNRQAVQRAQGSWGLAKLASMEVMLVYQERVALDAYISRTASMGRQPATANSCQEIVDLIDLPTKVGDVTEQLRKTQTMLSDSICSTKPGQYLNTNSECRFDVENLSYRYKEQAAALAAMVDQAMVTCHQIKAGNNAYLDSFLNSRF